MSTLTMTSRATTWLTTALLSLGLANAQGLTSHLSAQPLADALDAFSKDTGMQVFYDPRLAVGVRSAGATAGKSVAATLEELLRDTGLKFELLNEHTVTIVPRTEVSRSESATAAEPLRIAQTDAPQQGATPVEGMSKEEGEQLEEIVVTGSHIRGSTSSPSPLRIYERSDIDQSAAGSLPAFIKRLPQNFGGFSDDTVGGIAGDPAASVNETGGTSVNLRGLGRDSTLVLINGRRMAPSGFDGSFADISLLPANAIQRIEVLTDGASAIYGSDAVGGVINFILRKDFEAPETTLRYGTVSSGNSHEVQLTQTAGLNWNNGSALLSYEFDDRTPLDARDRGPPIAGPFANEFTLLSEQRRHGALLTAHHEIAPGFELFSDTTWGTRKNAQEGEPFGQAQSEPVDLEAWSSILGARKALPRNLMLEFTTNYAEGEQSYQQILRPAGDTIIARDTQTSVAAADVNLNGTLFTSPAGRASFAVGAQYREERLNREDLLNGVTGFENDRNSTAAFVEVRVPLIGSGEGSTEDNTLELVLADRYEKYSDFGDTNDPKFGVIWKPADGMALRATWGTSFKAPLLNSLDPQLVQIVALGLLDPVAVCDCGITDTVFILGGNPDLKAETSTAWTAGIDFRPRGFDGFLASATYYDIDYKDRITGPIEAVGAFDALLQETVLGGGIIDRNPIPAAIEALTANPIYQDARSITGSSGLGIAAIADYRVQNLSAVHTSGIDLALSYTTTLSGARWGAGLDGTYILAFDRKIAPGAPDIEILNSQYNPVDLRIRGRTTISFSGFTLALFVNYTDSYSDRRDPALPRSISSWTTADASASYEFNQDKGWLAGTGLTLSISNLTDEAPPFVPGTFIPVNYDGTNASVLGRFMAFEVSKRW